MNTKPGTRRAVLYARISVANEESVSIARQLESAQQYAAARGWEVVGTFHDDGVSATHNKPENRLGWRALLASRERYDAVIVWKIDRLARRVIDFLHADEALRERGAGIVAVEQSIDMTSPEGRMIAQVLAIFAEYEAAAIASRVAAARRHLIRSGRVVGGTVPYGWQSVPNPDGPGYVLALDPERSPYVQEAAERALRGDTLYSITLWLNEVGAPLPKTSQSRRKTDGWAYTTLERLLRNPVLAGMTSFNPDNLTKTRGDDVLRDEDGLPVVDESVALLSVEDWRRLVHTLDTRTSPQSRPRALKAKTSGLLSGLVWCGEHRTPVRMWRGTTQGRHSYSCPDCHQTISNIEPYVIEQFLWAKGEHERMSPIVEVREGTAAQLAEIENRLAELGAKLANVDLDADDATNITRQMARLRRKHRDLDMVRPEVEYTDMKAYGLFGALWAEATEVEDQRAILDDAVERITVKRGRVGRGLDKNRLTFEWKFPEQVGPYEPSTEADLPASTLGR